MAGQDYIQKSYDLISKDYNVGTIEDFKKSIEKPEGMKKVYDYLSESFNVGDFDSFTKNMLPDKTTLQQGTNFVTQIPVPEPAGPLSNVPEPVNPLTNPGYAFESIRRTGAMPTPKTADKEKMIGQTIDENRQLVNTQLDDVTKDIQGKSEQFRKEHPVLSVLSSVRGGTRPGVENEYTSDARYANLSAASRLLDESEQLLKAGNGGGIIAGAKDAASNIDTYSMGLSDLLDNQSVFNALQKYQENKPLTEDEERLLDAVSINAAARLAAKDPSLGYTAGSAFVQSVPFMLEMIANPISGAGRSGGKALAKYAAERFAKAGANKLLKGSVQAAGRVAADAMAATGMAMTTGAAGVAADTYNRMSGVPVVDNQFGEIQLSDVKGGESAGKAFYKSLASRSIENFSEMFGEYFGPIGNVLSNTSIGKKLSSSAIINQLNKLTYADWAKKYQDILKDGRFNGFIGETAEEYVGGLLNAALVGDQSFEDLASVENLVQTVSAVGLMSGVFGAVNLAGVRSARYQARKKLEKSEKEAYKAIGEDFNSLKEEMLNNDPDSRNAAMESIISSQDLSVKQKQSLINYLYYQNQYDGLLNGENKRVNETIEAENNAIREESNQETGMYVEASLIDPLTGERIPGTIVKGNMDDANLYVTWRGEDGNVKMVKKSDIDPATIQSMPTQDVIDSNATMMQQAAEKEIDHDMSYDPSIPAPEENLGTSFVLPDGGTYRFISTTPEGGFIAEQLDNEGNVIATTDQITAEDYYNSMQHTIDAVEDANNMSESKAQNETSPSGEESKVSETGTEQVSFPMKGEEIDYSKITEPNVYAAALQQEFGNDAASVLDEIITDKQAELEKASKGKDAITRRRVTNKINAELSLLNEARNIITPEQTKEVIKQVNDNVTEPTPVAKETVPELATAEEVQTEQAPLIPVNEQGVPQYHLTSIDNTLDDLLDGSLSIEEVNSFVDENIKAAEKELKEVEKRKPKMGTSKADYLAQRDAIAEELNAARQKVEYWNNVKKEITPEEQDSQVIDKWMNEEPMNLQELAAQMIATGRLKLLQADYKKQTGYGNKEARKMFGIFASKENGGVSLEKAGEIIELRAREEGLLSENQEIELNSGFEALMDVLTSSNTRGDINNYISRNREAKLNEEKEYQRNLAEQFAEEVYGMSYDDYLAYEESIDRTIRANMLDEALYNELQGEIYDNMMARERDFYEDIDEALAADRLNNVEQQQIEEDYGENESREYESLHQGSDGILPETQVNQEGRGGNIEETEQASFSTGSENGVTQNDKEVEKDFEELRTKALTVSGITIFEEVIADDGTKGIRLGNKNSVTTYWYEDVLPMVDEELNLANKMLSKLEKKHDSNVVLSNVKNSNDFWEWLKSVGEANSERGISGYDIVSFVKGAKEELRNEKLYRDVLIPMFEYIKTKQVKPIASSSIQETEIKIVDDLIPVIKEGLKPLFDALDKSKAPRAKRVNRELLVEKLSELTDIKLEDYYNNGRIAKIFREADAEFYWNNGSVYNIRGLINSLDKKLSQVNKKEQPATTIKQDESLLDFAQRVVDADTRAKEEQKVEQNPTDAQKEAGNYKKGHIKVDGLDITIEQPKGSVRSGKDRDGKEWSVTMNNTYGYIRGTKGVDGDHIDVFLSDDTSQGNVYVVDQVNPDGSFDEHKVMYGFPDIESAKTAYLSNYEKDWKGLGNITEVSKDDFKKWIDSSVRKSKPFAEYKGVENKSENAAPEKPEKKSVSKNKLVTDERYEELKKRMRAKLGGQMNLGVDPEILAIGTEMAVYHIEKGARKFADYAKNMIDDMGDAIRPYLKSFYNGARDLPEVQQLGWDKDMTSYDEVSKFDIANLGKEEVNPIETAQIVTKEKEVEEQADTAKKKIKKERNKNIKNESKDLPLSINDLFTFKNIDNEQGNTRTDKGLGTEAREETGRSERRGNDRGVHGDNVPDKVGSRSVSGTDSVKQPVVRNTNNFRFPENRGIEIPSGEIAKLKANIEAIKTLKEIEKSGVPATPEQQSKMAKYVGWGGLAEALNESKYNFRNNRYYADKNWNEKYLPYYEQIKNLLTKEEFDSAVKSTTTSHYTPSEVVNAMWNIAERLGFKGGNISEPAMGIGNILGMIPQSVSGNSYLSGFEIDSLSGRIAKALYPDANIKVEGYEKSFAPNTKDLVITNVPFGKNAPYDKVLDKQFRKKLGSSYNLHNYFILKGLLELKEGGLGVFVTTSATMDGADSRFREYISGNNYDLVGAIRLPNNAFLKGAGTSVTTDILIFRKRKPGESSNGIGYTSTVQIGEGTYQENGEDRTKPIMVNEYFANNPDMMLGEMMTAYDAGSGGLYSGASQTLKAKPGADLGKELSNAINKLPEGILSQSVSQNDKSEVREATTLKEGTITAKNGKVYVSFQGELKPVKVTDTFIHNGEIRKVADAVNDYNNLKEVLNRLISEEQTKGANPEPTRKELNKVYDEFVAKYGTLNRNKALDDVISEDVEHGLPLSLESVKRVPSATGKSMVWQVTKADGILNKRVSYPFEIPTKADNISDAVNISKSYKGNIDIPYIAEITGKTEDDVTREMLETGLAYKDPITGNIIDKNTYLSGNVKDKLMEARAAVEDNPEFQKNVDDLENVQPERIPYGDISFRLGTTWIPEEFINAFAETTLGISSANPMFVSEVEEYIVDKNARITDYAKSSEFKTSRLSAIDIFKAALNQRKPKVYDEVSYYEGTSKKTRKVVNEQETQAAAEKIAEMSDKFVEYMDSKTMFHQRIEDVYNDKYNNYVLKKYEKPAFDNYPNANKDIKLRDHQTKAVQRCLSESTLLAHQVGTGKTFTMITTAMEMRRLGIANKPMIVVQNATLEDFVRDFYKLYPSAKILSPSKEERNAENRKRLFNLIATGDFDAIVVPQSFMAFIPDSEERKKAYIQKRIDDFEAVIERIEDRTIQERLRKEVNNLRDSLEGVKKGKNAKGKAKTAESITAKTERILDRRTDDVLTFEQMGVDALFVDEAHNYKKIGFPSKMSNVKGIDTSASQRANSMLLKAQWVAEKNGGRNVILATGTPITNTMAEVWTMMNFVSPDILDAYSIKSFDEFATTFGTVEPSLEFTATGNFKIAERFKSYTNVPELVKAFRSHTDVVLTEDVKEFKQSNNIPKLKDNKMTNIVVEKNEDLEDVMQTLIHELEEFNKLTGKAKRDKSALPLVVFTKAKQAAIDLRLLNPTFPDNPDSKTNRVVENVLELYKESTPDKGTQLIFCDSYQSPSEKPKMDLFDVDLSVPQFNLYNDIKRKLVEGGIPANEIAIVSNYEGEKRNALFDKVRNGDVRVLIGSTEKMGVGVNVQDRLFALHHIDAPIRPMDFEQRNGRILRQGNLYATWGKPVNVVTYGVKGTLDATAYDRLRIKQNFINQMMKGDTSSRIMEEQDDEDPSGMTFSEMAATLSGDKTAQLLFVAQNKLKKLQNSKRSDLNSKSSMQVNISVAKSRLNDFIRRKEEQKEITDSVKANFPDGVESVTVKGKTISKSISTELSPIVEQYYDDYTLNRNTPPLKISLNNGKGEAIIHFNEGKMVYNLYVDGKKLVENRDFSGAKGLMASIDRQIESQENNLSSLERKIEDEENKISGLEEAIKKPWGKEEELKAAQQEVENLQKQLEEKAKQNDVVRQIENETQLDVNGNIVDETVRYRKGNSNISNMSYRQRINAAEKLAKRLNTNIQLIVDMEQVSKLDKTKQLAKGWYDIKEDTVYIVIPNNTDVADVQATVLHEVVAHKGLRKMFGEDFDTFLDNVYANATEDIRRKIVDMTEGNPLRLREATEEYLAELAEKGFDNKAERTLWEKVKDAFLDLLRKAGIKLDFQLTDNELRYILWRSYNNLKEGNILDLAEDITMRKELLPTTRRAKVSVPKIADDGTIAEYEAALAKKSYKAREAYQDSMLALKVLQDILAKYSGKPIKSWENAYMAENQLSSKNTAETEAYSKDYFNPIVESVAKIVNTGYSYRDVLNYMIAKHGLERNEVFARRDADQWLKTGEEDLQEKLERGEITEKQFEALYESLQRRAEEKYQENREKDYSGLSSLMEDYGEDTDTDYNAFAESLVESMESNVDTTELWKSINNATKKTLQKAYESGMMSKQAYDKVKNMFKYYIPLRGWNENTASDVYDYMNSERSPINSVPRKAGGRNSLADDPLATIGNMAESAILQGNRNLMKQNFLNMVINHPSSVAKVKDMWYVYNEIDEVWEPSLPQYNPDFTADEIADAQEKHEQRMKELKQEGKATKNISSLNVPYRVMPWEAKEHVVTVLRNGKEQVVFINGNPRAAQALNGMTNPDAESNIILNGVSRFNRQLAANFTTRNPAFVFSNLSRDLIFATSAVTVKEDKEYAKKFAKNILTSMLTVARVLKGKADMSKKSDAYFMEFLANGGETGYTALNSVDDYKKKIEKSLSELSNSYVYTVGFKREKDSDGKNKWKPVQLTSKRDYFKAVRFLADQFSTMNRWAEDISRFNTYMTSREMGRGIVESVNDAKEVTVNFNKKGAGYKTMSKNSDWYAPENMLGASAGAFRNLYLFFNAAVQSLVNFGRLAERNKKGFGALIGGFTVAGFAMPLINQLLYTLLGGDDDKDYYGDLPDWVRRNNLCIYAGGNRFITIPLPIELRAFYGLGDIAYQNTIGYDGKKGTEIAYEAINQMTELLPLNPLGNNGDIVSTVMPDAFKPFFQIYENKDFTGKPIYKESPFNKTYPEWTKTYRGTSGWLVDLAEWTNELGGGDKYKTSDVEMLNWNPAKAEHLFESYFGGMGKTLNQAGKTFWYATESLLSGEMNDNLVVRNVPVFNRFFNTVDDKSAFSKINNLYFRYLDEYEKTEDVLRGYSKEVSSGNLDYLEKLVSLQKSKKYQNLYIVNQSKKNVMRLMDIKKKVPETDKETLEKIDAQIMNIKADMVNRVRPK